VIFHDATLRAIAEADPADLDDLARIPGIGTTKLDRYGEAVLQQLFDAA
jgi:ATP-dependent DNA helicase RecQ